MAVTLSEKAARHVADYMVKRGKGIGLRLGVRTSGCSGVAYKLEFVDVANPDDVEFESFGVKVLIDAKAMMFLLGTEMDYQATALKSGFVFNNPNQVSACGCGESVQLKPANS